MYCALRSKHASPASGPLSAPPWQKIRKTGTAVLLRGTYCMYSTGTNVLLYQRSNKHVHTVSSRAILSHNRVMLSDYCYENYDQAVGEAGGTRESANSQCECLLVKADRPLTHAPLDLRNRKYYISMLELDRRYGSTLAQPALLFVKHNSRSPRLRTSGLGPFHFIPHLACSTPRTSTSSPPTGLQS